MNVLTGASMSFDFPPSLNVLQCCTDNLEHPIVTRVIVYMSKSKSVDMKETNSVYWDYINPVHYCCMSFSDSHQLW